VTGWYVPIITPDGTVWVEADDLEPWERSVSASHVNHVTVALGANDWDRLRDFEGVTLGGLPLATDPATIEDLDDRGALDFDAFYWDGKTNDSGR
jgi:hypothetical protein